ncbi:urease accessory protein UreE [Ovoidimarina sediminis]|uniref:urease accessory protein UreE n=1 Tax=Ovoidimarina sediminis TaxID=3079856 RepID=UPI002913BCEF|nr:urease accessory protein UreE [Rhodophyticola sp. MJ-SS7]MDU8945330.1 urease accessory protein UreE [Rhodophyticola sp. MJ-SS7]
MTLPRATGIVPADAGGDYVALDYEARLIRRKRLQSVGGLGFLVDLPEVVSVGSGEAFQLDDGRRIRIEPAAEPLLRVEGDLARLAWHIGNRHTPCRIEADALYIREDHVLRQMLEQLGARVTAVTGPFSPEGGAYGHGRTFGHSHDHGHSHA